MYAGRIAEEGDAREVFSEPAHPYTRELLRSTISLETTGLNYIPGRAAEPHRPAFRLPLPSALPDRDAVLPRAPAARGAGAGPISGSPAGCTARRSEIPEGGTEPLERGEIAIAEEA